MLVWVFEVGLKKIGGGLKQDWRRTKAGLEEDWSRIRGGLKQD